MDTLPVKPLSLKSLGIKLKYESFEGPDKNKYQPKPGQWDENIKQKLWPYFPGEGLVKAVNLAIKLNRPLLLDGYPGCGKSRLAHAIYYQFSQKYPGLPLDFKLWNVQSTSKAQDGFYTYDYVGRLQAAELAKANIRDKNTNPADPKNFVCLGPLGDAFENRDRLTIVLIDEIDKADTDFPNDLLLVLEEQTFEIKEVRSLGWRTANADAPPIIIITSNQERTLPNAFLRRCLYHYVVPPSQEQLLAIIQARFSNNQQYQQFPQDLVKKAIDRFIALRDTMNNDKGDAEKKVSTSELIDWFTALIDYQPAELIEQFAKGLPEYATLLKQKSDLDNYQDFGKEEEGE